MLSVIIPVYDEKESVLSLHKEIIDSLSPLKRPFEIVFVDDGSGDGTDAVLRGLSPATIVRLRRNFGKTAALDAGIGAAKGDYIVTIDGDGQNDPKDIPLLLSKLDEGNDAVVGRRTMRKDPLEKRVVSRAGYALRKALLKSPLQDSVCGLQAYRRECLEGLDLYGEIHRFIPDMLLLQGFKVAEADISHRPRLYGKTKFSSIRTIRGFLDLLSVAFWHRYSARPLHVFGGAGLISFALGTGILLAFFILRALEIIFLANRIWPLVGFFLILAGIELFAAGILADIALKNYYKGSRAKPYRILNISQN